MKSFIQDTAFSDSARAATQLFNLSQHISAITFENLRQLIRTSSDPDSALHFTLEFARKHPDTLQRLSKEIASLQDLVTVFAHSHFLSQQVIQNPGDFESLVLSGDIQKAWHSLEFLRAAKHFTREISNEKLATALSAFRKRQLVRILLRDVQGLATLAETTADISHLADAILEISYQRVRSQLESESESMPQCSVIALGKLGGQELNYSSDIDLMFVFQGGDLNFFRKFVNTYTSLLSGYTVEGICYRVDLRLRPEGRLGEVAISLENAMQYYRHRARDWELQMLIKARVAAGDRTPGEELLKFVEPLIYSTTLDFSTVEAVSEGRMRIHEKASQKRGNISAFDIKLMPGGIRDIEFLVQCLQRLHGGREPWVRNGGTLLALARLRDKELLSASEYSNLSSAYEFLRHLEHRLQVVDDRQTHTLPSKPAELERLARRMPPDKLQNRIQSDGLIQTLNLYLERVQQLYERVIHAQKPIYYGICVESSPDTVVESDVVEIETQQLSSNLVRFLDQSAPEFAKLIQQSRTSLRSPSFELFLEKLQQNSELLARINQNPDLAKYLIDIFTSSPWMSDAFNRNLEPVQDLLNIGQPLNLHQFDTITDVKALRHRFRREMLSILVESLCLHKEIFETLLRTSALVDAVISAAYRMAVSQTLASTPRQNPDYQPVKQMMVVALGRLGMLEFDLASDADLVFVLPDADESEIIFWTRVAERLIDILTAYTGDGTLIAVDTRLRPGGRDGQLVQTKQSFKEYFEKRAEAWEGISYMKARPIAGDIDRATAFLAELQKIDWRRYGQNGRSRSQLLDMRMRLEREQGPANELKAGTGSYYDIDFALMYLRLRGAGIFYKALNTPERIDIVEQMGHLDAEDADFLRKAATVFRAIDHGIRLQMGHSAGSLPSSSARLIQLTSMVHRWIPAEFRDQSLKTTLSQIQSQTREYFNRLFN